MKGKSWLKYLGYAVFLVVAIYLRTYVGERYQTKFSNEFEIDLVLIAIGMLITIGIGALLGGEHLIGEIRKTGKWKINLPKIIIIGLPMLYITLSYLGYYINIPIMNEILNPFMNPLISYRLFLIISNSSNLLLFQVILGYVVITSFYKCDKNAEIITG